MSRSNSPPNNGFGAAIGALERCQREESKNSSQYRKDEEDEYDSSSYNSQESSESYSSEYAENPDKLYYKEVIHAYFEFQFSTSLS